MSIKSRILAVAAPLALLGLSGCTTGFPAEVSRFQAMPAPEGQSFYVQPADAEERGGLEFAQYAGLVRQHLLAHGYAEAGSPQAATLIVTLDYGVDDGRDRVVARPDPFYPGYPFGYGGGFGRPYFSRYGYFGRHRSPFYWGWHDPWGPTYELDSYTVYTSYVDLDIRRAADGQSVFEGVAQARSRTDELPLLVPNLVEAMFSGFPGNSGETVRITVMPERDERRGG